MVGCEIGTDTLITAPVQSVTSSLLSSIFSKLILFGVLLGIAVLAIFLYRRSNQKEKKEIKEEKQNFRAKLREK